MFILRRLWIQRYGKVEVARVFRDTSLWIELIEWKGSEFLEIRWKEQQDDDCLDKDFGLWFGDVFGRLGLFLPLCKVYCLLLLLQLQKGSFLAFFSRCKVNSICWSLIAWDRKNYHLRKLINRKKLDEFLRKVFPRSPRFRFLK